MKSEARLAQGGGGGPVSLRLLSWNLHGVPTSLSRRARVDRAAEKILDVAPDVVLLQEVWVRSDARRVVDVLGSHYTLAEHPDIGVFIRRSGLLAMVRRESGWTIASSAFHEFQASAAGWRIWEGDGLGDKGVQRVDLERSGSRLVLLNTHLQAEYGEPRYQDVRARQLRELSGVAARVPRSIPVLAAGDLNTPPDERAVFSALGGDWTDLSEAFRRRCRCGTHYREDGLEGGWIDHVLARRQDDVIISTSDFELLRSEAADDPYSDHHGLLARVTLVRSLPPSPALFGLLLSTRTPMTRRQGLLAMWMCMGGAVANAKSSWCSAADCSQIVHRCKSGTCEL